MPGSTSQDDVVIETSNDVAGAAESASRMARTFGSSRRSKPTRNKSLADPLDLRSRCILRGGKLAPVYGLPGRAARAGAIDACGPTSAFVEGKGVMPDARGVLRPRYISNSASKAFTRSWRDATCCSDSTSFSSTSVTWSRRRARWRRWLLRTLSSVCCRVTRWGLFNVPGFGSIILNNSNL